MNKIELLLHNYKSRVDQKIGEVIRAFGEKNRLRDACEYALKNGGKRFRPAVVYMIAEALQQNNCVDDAALAIEFFHTASLIADDLPCMDNDSERRGNPALHISFGEETALLASYALIAAGYDRIRLNAERLRCVYAHEISLLAWQSASQNTGIFGATGGQFYDLMCDASPTEKKVRQVLYQKTGALFEISFVLGWLFGGGEIKKLEGVKKAAYHFGLAFQIADDIVDKEQDKGKCYNYALCVGEKQAQQALKKELFETKKELKNLQLSSLFQIVDLLDRG
ncbi:MAG: polyprenyl synthetase family protein [Chlamydiales bacterium]